MAAANCRLLLSGLRRSRQKSPIVASPRNRKVSEILENETDRRTANENNRSVIE